MQKIKQFLVILYTWSKRWLLPALVVLGVLFLVRSYQQRDLAIVIPNITVQTLTEDTVSLAALNQPTLIRFWAVWCGICSFENSGVESIAKDYQVINIAMQSGADSLVAAYARQHAMDIGNIVNDRQGALAKLFGVQVVPTAFVVDSQKRVAFKEVGYTTQWGMWLRLWWASI